MAYKWKPTVAQKKEYKEKMLSIAAAKYSRPEGYGVCCTGDCCVGDEVAFFQSGKSGERMFGVIKSESYGAAKQQHTFTISLISGENSMIKGRNLYENGVYRKAWANEEDRKLALEEKHTRGDKARAARVDRIAFKEASL